MIQLENLCLRNGSFELNDLSMTIASGSYGILMGRTGCGKTTILEAICGLQPHVKSGIIRLNDSDVTLLKPAERGIGYVPQDSALFETMSIFENVAFSLRLRKWIESDIKERVHELAKLMAITKLLDRRPFGLSGGEAKRVALARALAASPNVLCLDEPLSALDEETHGEICDLLGELHREIEVTILHITHSSAEAHRLGETFLRLEEGQLIERHLES
ncbi:MAG: ABC transporter ATP-binding protein [Planctomycetaceae bacterium]|nr:ABC transporter ATP-binding protein [Planctomycetaceae bacterium]